MPPWTMAWAYGVLGVVLVAAAVTDVRTGKVLNVVTYPAVIVGLVGHTVVGGVVGMLPDTLGLDGALAGLAVGFGPMLLVWRAGGIGGGDAKLMAAVGALAGWRYALAALFCGLVVAAAMAIGIMVSRRITRRTLRRIWQSLVLLFMANQKADPATAESPTVPFGLALCIGAALTLVDQLFGGWWTGQVLGI
jgi:prepilin peptidase CpaA